MGIANRFLLPVLLTAVLVPLPIVPGNGSASAATTQTWLQHLNQIRADAGLTPVTTDSSLTAGIKNHLSYLAKTPKHFFTGQYVSQHLENPASPYYTASGAYEGNHSDLAFGKATDLDALNSWLTAPFHAIGLLRPTLTEVAFARDPKTGDAGIDVNTHTGGTPATGAVSYPGASTTLTRFGGENPDPTQTCTASPDATAANAGGGSATGGQGKTGWGTPRKAPNPGLPLIALLPAAPAAGLTATVLGPGGTVASTGNGLCVVDSDTLYTTDKVYGPAAQEILDGDHGVLVIPRSPLVKGSYTVTISQPSLPDVVWSFMSNPAPVTPIVSAAPLRCSWSRGHSGAAGVVITNVADSTPAAAYTVTVNHRTGHRTIGDGKTDGVAITKLPAGVYPVAVKGGDGTSASTAVRVPACPAWVAVGVSFNPNEDLAHHRIQLRLDNTRNKKKTTFAITANGHHSTKHAVPGGKHKIITVSIPNAHKVTVVVKVAKHKVGREVYTVTRG